MVDHSHLQRARVALGSTLAEVAAAIGQRRAKVSLFETGRREDRDLAAVLQRHYESKGILFGEHGQVGFSSCRKRRSSDRKSLFPDHADSFSVSVGGKLGRMRVMTEPLDLWDR